MHAPETNSVGGNVEGCTDDDDGDDDDDDDDDDGDGDDNDDANHAQHSISICRHSGSSTQQRLCKPRA